MTDKRDDVIIKTTHKLEDFLGVTGGRLLRGDSMPFSGASVDSREVKRGDLFFCLEGAKTDGHLFADQAVEAGAVGVVCSRGKNIPELDQDVAVIELASPLNALEAFARYCRQRLRCPLIGVTGSNGKTTTKEMIASILAQSFGDESFVLKSLGNWNTVIGVSMSLYKASRRHRGAVIEMAMRGPGEILKLSDIAEPLIGVVTNVGSAHLESFNSLEEIAHAKGELLQSLSPVGFAIYPYGVKILEKKTGHIPKEAQWTFGFEPEARVQILESKRCGRITRVHLQVEGKDISFELPFLGTYNVLNAACAVAVSCALMVPHEKIIQGLEEVPALIHRSHLERIGGRVVMDDSYNANPESMRVVLECISTSSSETGGKAFALLGDMLELGAESENFHKKVGFIVGALGLAGLVTVGDLSRATARSAQEAGCPHVKEAKDVQKAVQILSQWVSKGDWVLIKGSRAMRLETAIEELRMIWQGES